MTFEALKKYITRHEPAILYEDNHLLIVNKPANLLVHGDETGDATLANWLKRYLQVKYQKPGEAYLGVPHRLDRPVSGAMVFTKTGKALTRMNEAFLQQQVSKTYWAVVTNRPAKPTATLQHYLAKNTQLNIVKVVGKGARDAKEARLTYELLHSHGKTHLLAVQLHTGRPHQIRVQLAAIGCPIIGDLKYGYPNALPDASIALHCRELSFVHPVTKELLHFKAMPDKTPLWSPLLALID